MKKCEKVHTKCLFQANWLIQALSGFIICWLQRNIERSGSGLTAVFNCLLVCQISSQSSYLFAVAYLGNQEISWAGLLYSIRLLEPSQHSTLIKSLPAPFLQCSNYIFHKKKWLSHYYILWHVDASYESWGVGCICVRRRIKLFRLCTALVVFNMSEKLQTQRLLRLGSIQLLWMATHLVIGTAGKPNHNFGFFLYSSNSIKPLWLSEICYNCSRSKTRLIL